VAALGGEKKTPGESEQSEQTDNVGQKNFWGKKLSGGSDRKMSKAENSMGGIVREKNPRERGVDRHGISPEGSQELDKTGKGPSVPGKYFEKLPLSPQGGLPSHPKFNEKMRVPGQNSGEYSKRETGELTSPWAGVPCGARKNVPCGGTSKNLVKEFGLCDGIGGIW